MKVVVCIKQSANGEINPFDASAYEVALQLPNAEVTILSMGPEKSLPFMENLTRLGAKEAILLTDKAFAGADTLATSYALSLAIERLRPELILCGRQSVDGDTGQVGPSLAIQCGYAILTNVMSIAEADEKQVTCLNRQNERQSLSYPALLTMEKNYSLRLPSIRSKASEVTVWNAKELGAQIERCGFAGSPTKVVKIFENDKDRRNCKFIPLSDLQAIIDESLKQGKETAAPMTESEQKLEHIWIVGKAPREMAETVGKHISVIPLTEPKRMAEQIRQGMPDAVLWGSDAKSKRIAPQVAALLKTGLCADCTSLETDGKNLYMYRPACSGNVIAKIQCVTNPPMATVRTLEDDRQHILVGIGFGAKDYISEIQIFAKDLEAGVVTSRKMVDRDYFPYEMQTGLTGKTVSPDVYLAVGISGAVHHIAGVRQSGTIIAINNDKNADIFKYADYGIVADLQNIWKQEK